MSGVKEVHSVEVLCTPTPSARYFSPDAPASSVVSAGFDPSLPVTIFFTHGWSNSPTKEPREASRKIHQRGIKANFFAVDMSLVVIKLTQRRGDITIGKIYVGNLIS